MVAAGDEVLVQDINILIPAKVIEVTNFMMQGNLPFTIFLDI